MLSFVNQLKQHLDTLVTGITPLLGRDAEHSAHCEMADTVIRSRNARGFLLAGRCIGEFGSLGIDHVKDHGVLQAEFQKRPQHFG